MVYRISKASFFKKISFFVIIWIVSTLLAFTGISIIVIGIIVQDAPFEERWSFATEEIYDELGDLQTVVRTVDYTPVQYRGEPLEVSVDGTNWERVKASDLEYQYSGGLIFYAKEIQELGFFLNNGSFYYVNIPEERFYFDGTLGSEPEVVFAPGAPDIIFRAPSFENVTTSESGEVKPKFVGPYYVVGGKSIVGIALALVEEIFQGELIFIIIELGGEIIGMVIIGGLLGVLTGIILGTLNFYGNVGGRLSPFILRKLKGRFGGLLGMTKLFDFGGDWFCEKAMVNEINLSGIRPILGELFVERWKDTLFFPTALTSTLVFGLTFITDAEGGLFFVALFMSPLIILVLTFYLPIIWLADDAGIKKLKIGRYGDLDAVRPVGSIIRAGTGLIVGFSGVISLGGVAAASAANITYGVKRAVVFNVDLLGILNIVVWTVGLFLLITSVSIVGVAVVAVQYFDRSHAQLIEMMRENLTKDQTVNYGTIAQTFEAVKAETVMHHEE